MAIVTGDWETYYDRDYSLTKMTTAEYVLDPRFEAIMLSLRVADQPVERLVGERAIRARLAQLDWSKVAWLSHHTNFDAAILVWRFGHIPEMFLCTLSMARAVTHWVVGSSSLAKVSNYLGLPPKGDDVVRAIGKRLVHFSPDELAAYASYCERDNDNCRSIFDRLRPLFSGAELRLIDLVVRMHVLPQVKLDPMLLSEHLAEVQAEKAAALAAAGSIDPSVFSSTNKFKELLESYGVDVPMKLSPTTGSWIPALAKNDRAMRELCEDASQPLVVQALLAARLQVKSTLEETRTQRFLKTSLLRWPNGDMGWAGVPVKYYGARTGRLSGDDKLNWQNLRRGSRMRAGVKAPPGFRVVHRDSSQIEARMVAWLARCMHLLDAFSDPTRDVYCEFATSVYGQLVTKADVLRRFVGKTGILSLGYSAGPARFRHMLFIGNGGISVKVEEPEAKRIVYAYRDRHPENVNLWTFGDCVIDAVIRKAGRVNKGLVISGFYSHIPITVGYDAVWLPNGMCLSYPELHYQREDDGSIQAYYKGTYGGFVKLYGAKFIENLSQALARIVITDVACRIYNATGMHPFLTTHDSLDYCVVEDEVQWWDTKLSQEFAQVPTWATCQITGMSLPLASEGGWGQNLLLAEQKANQ